MVRHIFAMSHPGSDYSSSSSDTHLIDVTPESLFEQVEAVKQKRLEYKQTQEQVWKLERELGELRDKLRNQREQWLMKKRFLHESLKELMDDSSTD